MEVHIILYMINVKYLHIMSSIIVNGQLQPRLLALLGYAALATITANNRKYEEAGNAVSATKNSLCRAHTTSLHSFPCRFDAQPNAHSHDDLS